jgi:hypothetical protein
MDDIKVRNLELKFKEIHDVLEHMITHLHNIKTTSLGKVEIISNGWDKMVGQLSFNNKDKYTSSILQSIIMIKPKVK